MDYIKNPMDIEKRSFEIIGEELPCNDFTEEELKIVKRVIHTTADFEYAKLIKIDDNAIEEALRILKKGNSTIYTDTNMIKAGVNKRALKSLNMNIECYVSNEETIKAAKQKGITRSMAGVETAAGQGIDFFVFGNAPTALLRLEELILNKEAKPKFVIAAPVGFVGAAASKAEFSKLDIPKITIEGRKGGSTVAASIVNALMYMIVKR
ncbi:MAG: precorrin-8X methylmutase [Clostridium sp.]|nr:precorrin-8X methylmutase [Clostridium sp.]